MSDNRWASSYLVVELNEQANKTRVPARVSPSESSIHVSATFSQCANFPLFFILSQSFLLRSFIQLVTHSGVSAVTLPDLRTFCKRQPCRFLLSYRPSSLLGMRHYLTSAMSYIFSAVILMLHVHFFSSRSLSVLCM